MPVPDFAQGIQISFLDSATRARMLAHAAAAATPALTNTPAIADATKGSDPPLSFDDLLDVVNPLQHLPVISTLYRHYTQDEIKPLPKIAGDALYGGWMGLASSVADYAFEKVTGKDFGDTVLAMVTGDDASGAKTATASTTAPAATVKPAAIASGNSSGRILATANSWAPQTPPPEITMADHRPLALSGAQPIPTIDAATLNAFMTAVNSKGLPGDLGQRTLDAYRRTVELRTKTPLAASTAH